MKKIRVAILAAFMAVVGLTVTGTMQPALAADCGSAKDCINQGLNSTGGSGGQSDIRAVFKTVANVLLFIVGAVAVIMLIIGGLRYVVSQGDSSQVQSAKNTILYSVIGLLVAIFAFAIVNFVISSFVK